MDKIDRAILNLLQHNGRLPNVQLAEQVGLSESACLRRVKVLEESGVIAGYVMLVQREQIGKGGNVFVRVTLDGQQQSKLAEFEWALQAVPDVMSCFLMSGDFDYLLRVAIRDSNAYEAIHAKLTGLPGVLRVQSSFALRTVRDSTAIEL